MICSSKLSPYVGRGQNHNVVEMVSLKMLASIAHDRFYFGLMYIAGIVLCLSWNFIAVIVCWIKEGGVLHGSLLMVVFSLYRPCTE